MGDGLSWVTVLCVMSWVVVLGYVLGYVMGYVIGYVMGGGFVKTGESMYYKMKSYSYMYGITSAVTLFIGPPDATLPNQ